MAPSTAPSRNASPIASSQYSREALTNAGKHAEATSYSVTISVTEDVSLEVQDNGVGVELPEAFGVGLGLVNLRNRAEKLGGSFEILTGEYGTRLIWRVPS